MFLKRFVHVLSFFFLLGAGLLSFFLILSGARHSGVLKEFYWFQGNTNGFNDASTVTRWYNYDFCGWQNNENFNCSSKAPAKPFSPRDNFGASPNMPSTFLNNRNTYYYLSRVAWAMLLIGFVFIMLAIIPACVLIIKVFKGFAIFSTVMCWLAWFFIILSACLYTGCYVKARKAFHHDDRSAKIGPKNFAFIWVTVALLLFNSIWTTITAATHGKDKKYKHYQSEEPEVYANYPTTVGNEATSPTPNAYKISSPTPIVESQAPQETTAQNTTFTSFSKLRKDKDAADAPLKSSNIDNQPNPSPLRTPINPSNRRE